MKSIATTKECKISALKKCGYFETLNPMLFSELAQGTRLRLYQPGEIVCWQGEKSEGLYIIHKGFVKLFKLSGKGRELVIRVFGEGTTFNEVPVFDGGENVVNVAVLEESEIWIVEREIIRKILKENPDMSEAVILNLSKNLRMLISMVEELSFCQVTNRLARLISQLEPDQLAGQATDRLTQDQLAAMLGTVREVVSRSLRDLERSGAIRLTRGRIQVIDHHMLQEWSQESA